MIITQAAVAMSSSHNLSQAHTRQASGQLWIGAAPPPAAAPGGVSVTISAAARQIQALPPPPQVREPAPSSNLDEPDEDPKFHAMRLTLELLTGKKINAVEFKQFLTTPAQVPNFAYSAAPSSAAQPAAAAQPERAGWGLRIDLQESQSEHEELSFSASGAVATADGRQLDFATQLALTRDFTQSSDFHLRAGDAALTDPLAINFDGHGAALTGGQSQFDLNSDGRQENISFLQSGSGFLALDRNQNGRIDNGRELFGPMSGNGFAELAQYDSDHNGWLDAKDPAMAQLRVWSKDESGADHLATLQEKQVGAIFLNSAATSFSLKDSDNRLQGQIQKTGVFLKENGEAGTVQELDLVT